MLGLIIHRVYIFLLGIIIRRNTIHVHWYADDTHLYEADDIHQLVKDKDLDDFYFPAFKFR